MQTYRSDVLVVGGGIAGITTALGLLDSGKSVVLLDRDEDAVFGGLARESFGGMFLWTRPSNAEWACVTPLNWLCAIGSALASLEPTTTGPRPGHRRM